MASEAMNRTGCETFLIETHYTICNCLVAELHRRNEAYTLLDGKFIFLSKLQSMSKNYIRMAAENLRRHYPRDLDENFGDEFCHFTTFMPSAGFGTSPVHCKK